MTLSVKRTIDLHENILCIVLMGRRSRSILWSVSFREWFRKRAYADRRTWKLIFTSGHFLSSKCWHCNTAAFFCLPESAGEMFRSVQPALHENMDGKVVEVHLPEEKKRGNYEKRPIWTVLITSLKALKVVMIIPMSIEFLLVYCGKFLLFKTMWLFFYLDTVWCKRCFLCCGLHIFLFCRFVPSSEWYSAVIYGDPSALCRSWFNSRKRYNISKNVSIYDILYCLIDDILVLILIGCPEPLWAV